MIFWGIIGIAFYNLASRYGKNKWIYLLIGIGTALLAQVLTGFLYAILFQPTEAESDENSLILNLAALGISGIITYIVYRQIRKKAESEFEDKEDLIANLGTNTSEEEIILPPDTKTEQDKNEFQ